MSVIVARTFVGAQLTNPRATLQHQRKHLDILPGPTHGQAAGRGTDIRTVEAGADALAHVHSLGRTSICARCAHFRTDHSVVRGGREQLVEILTDIRVKRDHGVDRHQPCACLRRVTGRADTDCNAVSI